MNSTSGASLAIVTNSMKRVPCFTPRTLIPASPPTTAAMNAMRPTGELSAGIYSATPAVNADATPEVASRSLSQTITPPRKPASGPNALPMYA